MDRVPGLRVRLKLTLSYAGFLMLAGALLLCAVWAFLLRGRPYSWSVPSLSDFLRALNLHNFGPNVFLPAALTVLAFLLVFGLVEEWILAGRMLAPLTRITDATRMATRRSLTHRRTRRTPSTDAHAPRSARRRNSAGLPPPPLTNAAPRWRSREHCSAWPAMVRTAMPVSLSTAFTRSTPGRPLPVLPGTAFSLRVIAVNPSGVNSVPSAPRPP